MAPRPSVGDPRSSGCPPQAHTPASSRAQAPLRRACRETHGDTKQGRWVQGRNRHGLCPQKAPRQSCGVHLLLSPISFLLGDGAGWGAGWLRGHPVRPWGAGRPRRPLTDARAAVRVQGVLLVAAAQGARVRVLAAVLAAPVSVVAGDWLGPRSTCVRADKTRMISSWRWCSPLRGRGQRGQETTVNRPAFPGPWPSRVLDGILHSLKVAGWGENGLWVPRAWGRNSTQLRL